MGLSLPVLGITAAIELIKFVQTSDELSGKTPEQVLDMWADTRVEVKRAVAAWRNDPSSQ